MSLHAIVRCTCSVMSSAIPHMIPFSNARYPQLKLDRVNDRIPNNGISLLEVAAALFPPSSFFPFPFLPLQESIHFQPVQTKGQSASTRFILHLHRLIPTKTLLPLRQKLIRRTLQVSRGELIQHAEREEFFEFEGCRRCN